MRTHLADRLSPALPLCITLVMALGAAGCGDASEAADEPTRVELSGVTQEQRIALRDVELVVDLPTELGTPGDDSREQTGCPASLVTFGMIPSGPSDHDPKVFFGSTDKGCPDEQSVNGQFPSWANVADLPREREELTVGAPVEAAYRFELPYTQCTNECYDRTYDVVFVALADSEESFWVQSTDVDPTAVDAILESLRLG